MADQKGAKKPELQDLPQIKDRMSFLYLEHCKISREDSAIQVIDAEGIMLIPSATISVLLLGPGTSVTHRAMELLGDFGILVQWVGEQGVRYYAGGRPLTHSSKMLIRQAEMVSNSKKHLEVVRKMYSLRFPDEDVSHLTTKELRGKEGARVRTAYQQEAKKWGVAWKKRDYKVDDFDNSDPVNQALTAGNQALYGLAHSVIFSLGLSPGLGFIHVGHDRSLVYDIADLYKLEIVVPLAFELASQEYPEIASEMRRRVRDLIVEKRLIERMVRDLKWIFSEDDQEDYKNEVTLWDSKHKVVEAGVAYQS